MGRKNKKRKQGNFSGKLANCFKTKKQNVDFFFVSRRADANNGFDGLPSEVEENGAPAVEIDNDDDVELDDDGKKPANSVLDAIYGKGATPRLQLRGGQLSARGVAATGGGGDGDDDFGVFGVPPNNGVPLGDVQALLLWLAADGTQPTWCAVRNKPLVTRVVCLGLQGITMPVFNANASTCMPFLRSLRRVRTRAPGEGNRINSPIPAILERPLSKKQLKALGLSADGTTPASSASVVPLKSAGLSEADYAERALMHGMSRDALIEHGFPVPLSDDETRTIPTSVSNACVGYVRAPPRVAASDKKRLVAIDCEMVRCGVKYVLAWLAVTSVDGEVLLDTLVKPSEPVTDYLTQFSGVSAEALADVTTTLADARERLFAVIDADTFICGHSLENDFHALELVHERVLDTSVLYPRGAVSSRFQKHALRYITQKYLQRQIQTGDCHSPTEDASAAMELTLLKLLRGASFGGDANAPRTTETLFAAAERSGKKCTIIDRSGIVTQHTADNSADAVVSEDDASAVRAVTAQLRTGSADLVWVQLHVLGDFYEQRVKSAMAELEGTDTGQASVNGFTSGMTPGAELDRTALLHHAELKQCLTELDNAARAVYDALPVGSVLLMPSLQGNASAVKRWHVRKRAMQERRLWSGQHDLALEKLCIEARDQAITFLAVRGADDDDNNNDEGVPKKMRASTENDDD
jgi:RNA exonuclease 1